MLASRLFYASLTPESGVNRIIETDSQGRFIVGKDAVPMKLWQQVDPGGKLHYSLIPADAGESLKSEESKSLGRSIKIEVDEHAQKSTDEGNRYCSLVHLCEVAIDSHMCDKCGMKFPTESMLTRHKVSHDMRHWLRRRKLKTSEEKYRVKSTSKKNREVTQQRPSERLEKRTTTRGRRKKNDECKTSDVVVNKSFACRLCDEKCPTQASLNKHTWEHKSEESPCFACDTCSFECKRSSTLASHVARNHKKPEIETEYPRKKCKLEKCAYSTAEKNDDCSLESERDNEPLVCTACDFQCKKRSTMTTHVAKKHVKKSLEEHCNLCDFKCSKKSTLYSHKRRHKAENMNEVYACNECGFKTSKKTSLYSHIKRKHKVPKSCTGEEQPELFYCNQCDYKNKNKYELKVHVARKHTDDFKFSCETCGKKFKVKGDLTNHIRFSHREQPVICDVCGKTCLNSNSLYVHQKFAHYKAKYECQVCKRRMVSQENLNEHMLRQHERRENVVCEECGKTFSRNSRLKVHMRIHTGDKPYTCTICNKSFARRTALKQHLLIHTGIRPYVCDICGKAFTQKPGLISHRKSHPGSHPPLPRVLIDHILNDVMNT